MRYTNQISRKGVGLRALGHAALVAGSGSLSLMFGAIAMPLIDSGQPLEAFGCGLAAATFAYVAYDSASKAKMHTRQYFKMRKRGQRKAEIVYSPY